MLKREDNPVVASMLQDLAKKYPVDKINDFMKVFNAMTGLWFMKLSDKELADINKILSELTVEEKSDLFKLIEIKYLSKQKFGGLKYEDGVFSCAQVASRKKSRPEGGYTFNPTVLPVFQLDAYLQLLKDNAGNSNLRERVILVEMHWVALDIEIKNGKVNILVVDSLGGPAGPHCLEKLRKAFPSSIVYYSKEYRLHSLSGCSVFAIDDAMHLFTLERYLPEANIFEYLAKQNQQPLKGAHFRMSLFSNDFIPVKLPLSLIRTAQDKKLEEEIAERGAEKDLPINKKGQTAWQSLVEKKSIDTKKMNTRLDQKLAALAKHNLHYLLTTPPQEIAIAMRAHTLEGFKERMKLLNLEAGKPSKPDQITPSKPNV